VRQYRQAAHVTPTTAGGGGALLENMLLLFLYKNFFPIHFAYKMAIDL
jgi:hypothetical protein